jgi:hypothetical protein
VGTVDIPALARTGAAVESCAADVGRAYAAHAGDLAPRLAAGWATGAAGAAAAGAWRAFLTQLAGQVRELGQALGTSAREYQAADEAAAGRVHTAAAGIPAGHPAQARAHGHLP